MTKSTVKIIVAIIGLGSALVGGLLSGQYIEQNKINSEINAKINVNGSNNSVAINDVSGLLDAYTENLNELNNLNDKYEKQEAELNDVKSQYVEMNSANMEEIKELENQLSSNAIVKTEDAGLVVDGDEIKIQSKASIATLNGRTYYSEEIVDSLLDDREINLKNGTLYVGKIVEDKTRLSKLWVIENSRCDVNASGKDSFGNTYSDAVVTTYSEAYVRYNANRDFSLLKCTIATNDYSDNGYEGTLKIKADETVVYETTFKKSKEPIEIKDVPIDNCSVLTFEVTDAVGVRAVISDGFVYN